ncbi:MAG: AarF/UbiB family protein [Myxococcota bacterium]|nr:AarF/UbiB family protein [Myxococcota bacterium]
MGRTAGDVLLTRLRGLSKPPAERPALHHEAKIRTLTRAVSLLGRLKGAFVKAGQFAALRHDLIPAQTGAILARLRDRVPALSLRQLEPLILTELGAETFARIADIEANPLGSASLAQAHRARLTDGSEVVIKIQYPWIEKATPRDLALLRLLARSSAILNRKRTASIDAGRLFNEFSEGLMTELDFCEEANAAQAIAANLASVNGVVVPKIYPELSSKRILTMSYHPCIPIHDAQALHQLGVRPSDLLQRLAHAYAKQVFVDGLFHADPHPGNLFVLNTPDAAENPQVLFVDFGLCRRLDPELKRAMRQGIYAVLQREPETFIMRMTEMGMIAPGSEVAVRSAVLEMFEKMQSAASEGGPLGASSNGIMALKDEAKRLLQSTPGVQLPNDLLLYAKTLSYLFALGESLDPEVDLMKITLPYLLRFLAAQE